MSKNNNELEISRFLAVPRARVWEAWTNPQHLAQWWCPKPWTTEVRALDLRPGGAFYTFMSGPDGGTSDNPGCFLEVVPQERLVFTTVLTGGWRPGTPWLPMTAIITFAEEGQGTRYVARVIHKDEADSQKHETMGFFKGWGSAIAQLEAYAKQL